MKSKLKDTFLTSGRVDCFGNVAEYLDKHPMKPNLNSAFLEWLDGFLQPSMSVLEFGSGGSTPWFAQRVGRVVSLEHDFTWARRVTAAIKPYEGAKLIFRKQPYAGVTDKFEDKEFDFILVDGRDRVVCFKAALRLLKPNGWIALDDSQRDKYAPALQSVNSWEQKTCEQLFTENVRKCSWWRKPPLEKLK